MRRYTFAMPCALSREPLRLGRRSCQPGATRLGIVYSACGHISGRTVETHCPREEQKWRKRVANTHTKHSFRAIRAPAHVHVWYFHRSTLPTAVCRATLAPHSSRAHPKRTRLILSSEAADWLTAHHSAVVHIYITLHLLVAFWEQPALSSLCTMHVPTFCSSDPQDRF